MWELLYVHGVCDSASKYTYFQFPLAIPATYQINPLTLMNCFFQFTKEFREIKGLFSGELSLFVKKRKVRMFKTRVTPL